MSPRMLDSQPPTSIASARPMRTWSAPSRMAEVPDAQAFATPKLGPRSWWRSASRPVTAVPVMEIAVIRAISSGCCSA
jgi:hypothetical protein